MLRYSSSVTISKPPDVVYQYLVDPALQAKWSDVPMRRLDGDSGAMAKGTRFEVTFRMGPLKAKVGLELVAVEPATRMAWRTFSGPIKWDGEYRVTATADGGSQLSQEGTLTFTGLWRAMEPMAGAEISRGEEKELERLKALAEAS